MKRLYLKNSFTLYESYEDLTEKNFLYVPDYIVDRFFRTRYNSKNRPVRVFVGDIGEFVQALAYVS